MEEATAAQSPLEMETASRRQSATTRVWGSIGSAEIFAEGTAYATTNDKVRRAPHWTGQIQAGRGGRLMELARELGVHAGEWSALPCGSAAPPAERDYPLAKGGNNTHPHTHT